MPEPLLSTGTALHALPCLSWFGCALAAVTAPVPAVINSDAAMIRFCWGSDSGAAQAQGRM